MSEQHKVGDELGPEEVNALPVGAIVRNEHRSGNVTVIVRVQDGWHWSDSNYRNPAFDEHVYATGPWTLVFLPELPPLKVGDVIDSEEKAARCPIGSVVVDTADNSVVRRPAIKVRDDEWLFEDGGAAYLSTYEIDFEGSDILVYLPDADTGAGSTAA